MASESWRVFLELKRHWEEGGDIAKGTMNRVHSYSTPKLHSDKNLKKFQSANKGGKYTTPELKPFYSRQIRQVC